ncbi:hypothetical protein HPE56_06165 [Maribacter sp. ANRC-HE7]|uniref:Uncharacterized protein n=1 Tax=Maribacter aquimaris TaxID=2737171 RepID=A0ABR7UZ74_9FLAO|nr:hypothetical protein [Maribacter aquimaris]
MCILTQVDFGIIWRYFAWSNQILATVVLCAITAYLTYTKKFIKLPKPKISFEFVS